MVYIPQPVSLPSVHPRRLFLRPGIIVRRLCFPRGVRGLLFLPPPCLAPRGTRACVGLRPGLSGSNVSVGSRKMGDRGGTRSRRAPCGFAHLQLFVTHCEAGCPDGAVYLACRLGYRSVHEHGEGPLALHCRGHARVGGFDEIPGGSQRPMACGSALDTSRMAWGGAAKRCGVVCGRGGFSDRDSVCDTRLAHLHRLLPESRGAHAYDVVWIGGSDRLSVLLA